MNKHELTALAERVEAAEGPSRELDAEIAMQHMASLGADMRGKMTPAEYLAEFPNLCSEFTASIDAALTLAPEGSSWQLRWWSKDNKCWCTFYPPGHAEDDYFHLYDAATPALALAAAALRSQAQGEG